jgi:hypothetical protein
MLRRLFGRLPAIRPEFLDAPDGVILGDPNADRIRAIDQQILRATTWDEVDALLDERLKLRPAPAARRVPVVPGGGGS